MNQEDYIVRAMGADRQLRLFAVTSRNLVERAREIHNTSPVATAALGRLLTAGSMMGSMMKGDKDVLTLQIQCGGPIGGLTVTADAQANVKGYVKEPNVILPPNAKGKLDVAGAVGPGFLNVIRDIGMKEPYNGQTHLVSGEIAGRFGCTYGQRQSCQAGGRIHHSGDAFCRGYGDRSFRGNSERNAFRYAAARAGNESGRYVRVSDGRSWRRDHRPCADTVPL